MAPKATSEKAAAPSASGKKVPAAKKIVKKSEGGKGRRSKTVESYKIYIYKVLKQVNPLPAYLSVLRNTDTQRCTVILEHN